MRPFSMLVISLFLVGSCDCHCPAQTLSNGGVVKADPNKKLTGHDSNMYRAGQTIDFPTGNDRLQLSVIVSPDFRADPRQKDYKVAQWFTNGGKNAKGQLVSINPRLRQIQESCAYRYVNANDPNFAQTARIEMLGNTDLPIVMLTGPDGKIKRDRSGGLLMYGTDLQSLNDANDMADYLIAAAEKFNEKPDLVGLVNNMLASTPAVLASCSNCGTYTGGGPCPNCTPSPSPQPNNNGTVPAKLVTIKPRPGLDGNVGGLAALGVFGAVVLGLGYVAIRRPGIKH